MILRVFFHTCTDRRGDATGCSEHRESDRGTNFTSTRVKAERLVSAREWRLMLYF